MMLSLVVDEVELKTRLSKRASKAGRPDDADPEIIQNRINNYNEKTAPVAQYYDRQNKLIEIDGEGSIDGITDRLFVAIDNQNSEK